MTISLHASSAPARLSVAPLTDPLPRVPHLVAPERASIGDFIGVFGGIINQSASASTKQVFCEVAYRKGVLEPENAFIDEMSDADAAVFEEITAVPFCGIDHHLIVRQARMVEPGEPFQIHLVQFADAILYVHPDWLYGNWGRQPGHGASRSPHDNAGRRKIAGGGGAAPRKNQAVHETLPLGSSAGQPQKPEPAPRTADGK